MGKIISGGMDVNIYVGNLSPEVTEQELRQQFVTFGQVSSVILMDDRAIGSGRCRSCGFVEMPQDNEGANAMSQLQGQFIHGRRVDLIKALPLTRMSAARFNPGSPVSGFLRKSKSWSARLV
jgi:RNA recognition motif-containing protein